jgi:hypothetical protein
VNWGPLPGRPPEPLISVELSEAGVAAIVAQVNGELPDEDRAALSLAADFDREASLNQREGPAA